MECILFLLLGYFAGPIRYPLPLLVGIVAPLHYLNSVPPLVDLFALLAGYLPPVIWVQVPNHRLPLFLPLVFLYGVLHLDHFIAPQWDVHPLL